MHIPENYLSPSTCGVLAAAMVPVWVHATRRVRAEVPREKMPLLGVAAALSFLAMMFNVPVPGGTSGHAVCGTLIAVLFGPWPAVIALSVALALQALLFGDGGVLALGANCFNMAFVLPMVGYGVYSLIVGRGKAEQKLSASKCSTPSPSLRRELVAAGVGSYVGINAAALCAAVEFGIQPLLFTNAAGQALYCPYPLWVSVPAMMAAHLTVCGAAEVVFTAGILAYVRKVAPSFGLAGIAGASRSDARASFGASGSSKTSASLSATSSAKGAGSSGANGYSKAIDSSGATSPFTPNGFSKLFASSTATGSSRQNADASTSAVRDAGLPRAMVALLVVLIVLVPVGLLAQGDAWGEWSSQDVAQAVGYMPQGLAQGWEWTSLLPDYSWGALPSWLGYVLSAVIGVALLVIVFRLAASGMRSKVQFGER